MVRFIHVMAIGPEKAEKHLDGLAKFKADEVLLFSTDSTQASKITKMLEKMGIAFRILTCKHSYYDSYRIANEEASGVFVDDVIVAINVSTGPAIVQEAIHDAFRIQLYSFNRRSPTKISAAAFRYEVPNNVKLDFPVAPIWNHYNKDHNDIFETLVESTNPQTVKDIWDVIASEREDISLESFRKVFREFKRWFMNTPYFSEKIKKGPIYQLEIN